MLEDVELETQFTESFISTKVISEESDLQLRLEAGPVDALLQFLFSFVGFVRKFMLRSEGLTASQGLNEHLPCFERSKRRH